MGTEGPFILRAVRRSDLGMILEWRQGLGHTLRTPMDLTLEQQEEWYSGVVCDRNSPNRYWMVEDEPYLQPLGIIGLERIEWTNGRAEISMLLAKNCRGEGYGPGVLSVLLDEGFKSMGLRSIWGECYECAPALSFWQRECSRRKTAADPVWIPEAKWWDGKLWRSYHFTFVP